MQLNLSRSTQRQLVRWIMALIAAIAAAIAGREGFAPGRPREPVPASLTGMARLVDGDSLFVGRDEVRLKGIDAPEGRQSCSRGGRLWACGDGARDELRRLIGRASVTCAGIERDQHSRILATCTANGRDLNAAMVAAGMALAYGGYLREEGEAKAARRGLWSGDFEKPRDWRRKNGIGGGG